MYTAITIAEFFIDLSLKEGIPVTPMKLQKLIYFSHGFYLAKHGHPLIVEQVQAWKYGPVIQSIYHHYKEYGNLAISKRSNTFTKTNPRFLFSGIGAILVDEINESDRDFLIGMWNMLKRFSAIQLSNLTHVKKSPWDEVVEENGAIITHSIPIQNERIRHYFKREYSGA